MNATPTPSEQPTAKDLRQPAHQEAIELVEALMVKTNEGWGELNPAIMLDFVKPFFDKLSRRLRPVPVGDKPSVSGVAGKKYNSALADVMLLEGDYEGLADEVGKPSPPSSVASPAAENGCTCQRCGRKYTLDLKIPDEWWEKIKPKDKPVGAGLLCPQCILNGVVELLPNGPTPHPHTGSDSKDLRGTLGELVQVCKRVLPDWIPLPDDADGHICSEITNGDVRALIAAIAKTEARPVSKDGQAPVVSHSEAKPESSGAASPWIRTADRKPTRAESLKNGYAHVVLTKTVHNDYKTMEFEAVRDDPHYYPFWMPIPALPDAARGLPIPAQK